MLNLLKRYVNRLKNEFHGYNLSSFSKDVMAGLTVTAVALPLALAFGVSSGATAAAGLVTAIMAGIIIGALSGASPKNIGRFAYHFGLSSLFHPECCPE